MSIEKRITMQIFGNPIKTSEAQHQTISNKIALAVFSSDSLSSVAYAGGEILMVLSLLGASFLWMAIPISAAISMLMVILILSYRQTIHSYPDGGGAYVVSRDNFGDGVAQIAGASLLTDYILTVAVSVSSSVDQLASMFPLLFQFKVQLILLLILFITVMNLRGVKESGKAFAIPTYFFITMMFLLIGTGLFKALNGTLGSVEHLEPELAHTGVTTGLMFVWITMRAFSTGTAAVTGVEAISNGIPAFKEPKAKNAANTLMWGGIILISMFMGLALLGTKIGAQFSEHEVLISQVARTVYGPGALQFITLLAATVILAMAANTSYADFPRLAAIVAGDRYLPNHLAFRSSRLVFNWGIISLALFASILIIIFKGNVSNLIPLYAIGVFTSLTMSQWGMVKRWFRVGQLMKNGKLTQDVTIPTVGGILSYDKAWQGKMILNAFGGSVTAIVAVIFLVTKFAQGAWLIAIIIPLMVYIQFAIHKHYKLLAKRLSRNSNTCVEKKAIKTLVMVADVHKHTETIISYALSLENAFTPVYVSLNKEKEQMVKNKWSELRTKVKRDTKTDIGELLVLEAPYRSISEPIIKYMDAYPDKDVCWSVIMGHIHTGNWLTQILHQNAALILEGTLRHRNNVTMTVVPFNIKD